MIVLQAASLDEPDLHPYRTLRRPAEHERSGIFVAEGEKVVRRLLESGIEILSVLLTPEWLDLYRPLLEGREPDVRVFVAQKSLVETIVGFNLHQGIMAVARIPNLPTVQQALSQAHEPFLLVAIDGITNAENLGVLVRNCAAFHVDALLVGETSSSPYLRRAVRNSMGTVFRLPVVRVSDLAAALKELRLAHGLCSIAAHPHADRKTLSSSRMNTNICFVFGSEGDGISQEVLAACDEAVAIPMSNGVDSLNVASASAVFLYEAQRQREALRS